MVRVGSRVRVSSLAYSPSSINLYDTIAQFTADMELSLDFYGVDSVTVLTNAELDCIIQ